MILTPRSERRGKGPEWGEAQLDDDVELPGAPLLNQNWPRQPCEAPPVLTCFTGQVVLAQAPSLAGLEPSLLSSSV